MNRNMWICLAALLVVASVGASSAHAQFGTLGQAPARPRPTVSPFITQGVGGGINAFSYYGLIKPQFDITRSLNQLQQGMQHLNPDGSLQTPLQTNQAVVGSQTGHPTTFFNYSHYFPMSFGSGSSTTGSNTGLGSGMNNQGFGGNTSARPFYGSTLNTFGR